mgnify:CR=1 FL=1
MQKSFLLIISLLPALLSAQDTVIVSKVYGNKSAKSNSMNLSSLGLFPKHQAIYTPKSKWVFKYSRSKVKDTDFEPGKLELKVSRKGARYRQKRHQEKVAILESSTNLSFSIPELGQASFMKAFAFSTDLFYFSREINKLTANTAVPTVFPPYFEFTLPWGKEYKGVIIDSIYQKRFTEYEKEVCDLAEQPEKKVECFKNRTEYKTAAGTFVLHYWIDPLKYGIMKIEIIQADNEKILLELQRVDF